MKRTIISMYGRVLMFVFVILGVTVFAQSEKKLSLGDHQIFKVSKATQTITVDGKLHEEAWQNTEVRTLDYFYRIEKTTDKQQSKYRMLWDEAYLYVFFECQDEFITAREKNRDGQPYLDDCAELFLIPVPDSLNMHYGFEVNLYRASNDFIWFNNFYHNQSGMIKSYDPDFEVAVQVHGTINNNTDKDEAWTMEMAIPLKHFKGLDKFFPVKSGNRWAFLAVRQDRNDASGDRRSTSTIFPIYDIDKSVHQPNRFGLLQFEN